MVVVLMTAMVMVMMTIDPDDYRDDGDAGGFDGGDGDGDGDEDPNVTQQQQPHQSHDQPLPYSLKEIDFQDHAQDPIQSRDRS